MLLRSQNATSNGRGGRRYLPFAFTEQGIAMLSGVLRSDVAVQISIRSKINCDVIELDGTLPVHRNVEIIKKWIQL